jgi:SagB-type dehydrogenase family enzyme
VRASRKKTRRPPASTLSARLTGHVALEAQPDGSLIAGFDGYSIALGKFSAATLDRARGLRTTGLPFDALNRDGNAEDQELGLLVRRLARRGLVEYGLATGEAGDEVVIEPQVADYWPQLPVLGGADMMVLSRFAYLRRRGHEIVLESPRAGALFRIGHPALAATLVRLATPHSLAWLRRQQGFPGVAMIALLVDCRILLRINGGDGEGLRAREGDDHLVLWDFHDLLFHTHSTEGRHANPIGGVYPYADVMPPPPAIRPRWPGRRIDLGEAMAALPAPPPIARLLRARHSTREFDARQPITLAELARFLDCAMRVQSTWKSRLDLGDVGPMVTYTTRPYPSGGSSYELETYLAVAHCEGLARGYYHYDADRHALVPIKVRASELEAMLTSAGFAMDASGPPQVLLTIAARFDRVSWKYSSIAYSLILKDVGVLIQTLYLAATDMGLGGCAIGTNNIELFARMTGIEFHIEGPVGQFALGRGTRDDASGPDHG